MAIPPSEFLKSLSADYLNGIVDRDLDANEQGAPEAPTVIDLVFDRYEELSRFIEDTITRLPDAEELSEKEIYDIKITAVVAVGALCRAAEIHDMPQIDPPTAQ